MIRIDGRIVMTDEPGSKRLHRLSFDAGSFFTAATLLAGETEADFEEVSEWPAAVEEDEGISEVPEAGAGMEAETEGRPESPDFPESPGDEAGTESPDCPEAPGLR